MSGIITPGQVSNRPRLRHRLNSGLTSETTGKAAMAKAMDRIRRLPGKSSRAIPYAAKRGEDHAHQGRQRHDADRVAQGAGEEGGLEHRAVVAPRPMGRPELLVGDVGRRLERQRQDPHDRQEGVQHDEDRADDPHGLLTGGLAGHQSLLTEARLTLNPLTKMKAISTTERNSRTDRAEPRPSSARCTVWR